MPLYDVDEMIKNRPKLDRVERVITFSDMLGGLFIPIIVVFCIGYLLFFRGGYLGVILPGLIGTIYLVYTYKKTRLSMIAFQIIGYLVWSGIVYFVLRIFSYILSTSV